jgi:hypothetical protein
MTPQQPTDSARDAFIKTLQKHGFDHAAAHFKQWIDFDAARKTWNHYPASMSKYPMHLTNLPTLKPRREGLEGRYE